MRISCRVCEKIFIFSIHYVTLRYVEAQLVASDTRVPPNNIALAQKRCFLYHNTEILRTMWRPLYSTVHYCTEFHSNRKYSILHSSRKQERALLVLDIVALYSLSIVPL